MEHLRENCSAPIGAQVFVCYVCLIVTKDKGVLP